MAQHSGQNWTIYQDQFWGGFTEVIQQNTAVFNEASAGAIMLRTESIIGDYQQQSFIKEISGLVSRRDIESVAGASDIDMDMDEEISVKVARKIGPVARTLDSWKKIGTTPEAMSFLLGQQAARAALADYVNTITPILVAASGLSVADTGTDIVFADLVNAMQQMGDASNRIVAWLMHGTVFHDLVGDGIANYKIENVAGMQIVAGTMGTMGRPAVVTDSSGLINTTPTPDEYHSFGLTEGAVEIVVSEDDPGNIESDMVLGLENIVMRLQGEYTFNVKLKGFKWDITNGGRNPAAAALATATNWDQNVTDLKNSFGVEFITAAAGGVG